MGKRRRIKAVIIQAELELEESKPKINIVLIQKEKGVVLVCEHSGGIGWRKRLTEKYIKWLNFYKSPYYEKIADYIGGRFVDGSAARIRRIYDIKIRLED